MRVSIKEDDPGYSIDHMHVKVLLNGVEIDNCITADEEQGYVVIYLREQGKYVVKDDKVVRRTIHGVVQIINTRGERA